MTDGAPARALRRSRIAVVVVFVAFGLNAGSWLARVPEVKLRLRLGDDEWGRLAVLGSLGSLTAMLVTALLIGRFGERVLVRAALPALLACGPFLAASPSPGHLALGLAMWGMSAGTLQGPVNASAVAVEADYGRPIMGGFHAGWSIGTLAGALAGAAAARAGVSPQAHLAVTAVLLAGAAAATTRWLPAPRARTAADPPAPADSDRPAAAPSSSTASGPAAASDTATGRRPWRERLPRPVLTRQLLLLAGIALASSIAEGTTSGWAGIYVHETLGGSKASGALAYACFTAAMTAGRLGGDRVVHRLGRRRFLRVVPLVAALGLTAGLAAGTVWAAYVGFVCAGLGLSCVAPTVFGAAGTLDGVPTGAAMSTIAMAAWPAFLAGPPIVGAIAHATSLRLGLGVVVLGALVVSLLATRLHEPAARCPQAEPEGARTVAPRG